MHVVLSVSVSDVNFVFFFFFVSVYVSFSVTFINFPFTSKYLHMLLNNPS